MLGINEELKSLHIETNESGTAISEIYVNDKRVDKGELNVQRLEFVFSRGEDGFLCVTCRKSVEEGVFSKTKTAAAARAGTLAATRSDKI